MKRWRDLLLVFTLFALLIGFTVYGARRVAVDDTAPAGSTHSAAPSGAFALRSWLDDLGYNADPLQYTGWALSPDVDALFMLAPAVEPITEEEADATLRWVQNGGPLVLIVPDEPLVSVPNALVEQFGATIVVPDADAEPSPVAVAITQPVLTTPPAARATVDDRAVVTLERSEYVPLVTTEQGDVLVGFALENGYVYLGTSLAPFVNDSIREPDNPALVLNLLRRVPAGGSILFDEYHHGFRQVPDAARSALDYWWGWAALYAMLVTGLYVVLTGRRFGKAVPLPQDIQRRSSAEYAQSLGTLFRRAGKRSYIAEHYHDRWKRRVARPYGFVPLPDDAAFVRELAHHAALADEQITAVQRVLAQFRNAANDEQLAQAVRAADALLDRRGQLRNEQ
jgi:hypothetical protein